jgi:hypothetical protein
MVPDGWIWAGIIAAILSLVALQPLVYRFLAEQFWPFGVRFIFQPQIAQAGGGVVLNIEIRNRTPDRAYFQIGTRWVDDPTSGVRSFRFIHTSTYRHIPLNEHFSGQLALAPYEFDRVAVRYTPTARGPYEFTVELSEYSRWSRFPRLVVFNRQILRRKNPNLHLFNYSWKISFDAQTWAISLDQLAPVIGRNLTPEERELEAEYDRVTRARVSVPSPSIGESRPS